MGKQAFRAGVVRWMLAQTCCSLLSALRSAVRLEPTLVVIVPMTALSYRFL